MIINLSNLKPIEKQYYLHHIVAPRPICFASTIDKLGNVNLSPFSFFNLFSTNPPVAVFSPSRRATDNTVKHTYQNVLEHPEVVINMVTYDMVQQTSLASCAYPKEVNEFIKAGFTEEPATLVKPPMVKESKLKLECKVLEIKSLGTEGGAGNLVICEILCMHIDDSLLDQAGKMDQRKIHHVGRLGGDWYCVVNETNLFQVRKPILELGIGIDALPESVRLSTILSGNNLGQLGNVREIPAIDPSFEDDHLKQIILYYNLQPSELERELHLYARQLLDQGKLHDAWQVLLAGG